MSEEHMSRIEKEIARVERVEEKVGKKKRIAISRRRVSIRPAVTLVLAWAASGYAVDQCIGELVDNSIDAATAAQREGKDRLRVEVVIKPDSVVVRDNGKGMDGDGLHRAMTGGVSDKRASDIGHFGLGLKTGGFNLGKYLSISTRPVGSPYEYSCYLDVDEFVARGDVAWDDFYIDETTTNGSHGTLVSITKLNYPKKYMMDRIKKLYTEIGNKYRDRINSGAITVTINGVECKPSTIVWAGGYPYDFKVRTKNGHPVRIVIGIQQKGSHRRRGFDLFKNGRMIESYAKELSEDADHGDTSRGNINHPSYQWVYGLIYIDDAPTNSEKSRFTRGNEIYIECINELVNTDQYKEVIREARKRSAAQHNVPKITLDNINRVIPYLVLSSGLSHPMRGGFEGETKTKTTEKEPVKGTPRGPYGPRKTTNVCVVIDGKGYYVTHDFAAMDPDVGRFEYSVVENNLMVTTNISDEFIDCLMRRKSEFAAAVDSIASSLARIRASEMNFNYEAYDSERERIAREALEKMKEEDTDDGTE